jgi:hypothetical protein
MPGRGASGIKYKIEGALLQSVILCTCPQPVKVYNLYSPHLTSRKEVNQ